MARFQTRLCILWALPLLILSSGCGPTPKLAGYGAQSFDASKAGFYEKKLAQNPNDAESTFSLGVIRLNQAQMDQALTHAGRAVALEPMISRYQLLLGHVYYFSKDYYRAIEHLTHAQALDPDLLEPYLYLGLAYVNSGRPKSGLGYFETALELEPLYFQAHLALIKTQAALTRDSQELLALIEQMKLALKIKPASIKGNLVLAELYQKTGFIAQAIKTLEQALEQNPDEARLITQIATLEYQRGNDQATLEFLNRLKEKDLNAQILHLKARLALGQNHRAKIKALLKANPRNPELRLLYSEHLLIHDSPQKAEQQIRSLIRFNPESVAAYLLLYRVLDAMLDARGAQWALDKALKLDPQHPKLRLLQVRQLIDQGAMSMAEKLLSQLETGEDQAGILLLKAEIETHYQRFEQAEQILNQASRLGEAVKAEIALIRLDLAQNLPLKANKRLKELKKTAPKLYQLRLLQARLALAQSETDKASQILNSLLNHPGARGRGHLMLGWQYLKTNRLEKAATVFKHGLERWPGHLEMIDAYTFCLGLQGHYDKAIKLLRRTLGKTHSKTRLFRLRLVDLNHRASGKITIDKSLKNPFLPDQN